MSNILYLHDDVNDTFDIKEDTIIYHFNINNSSNININLDKENVTLYYYYNDINYDDNEFRIKVNHNKSNTNSYLYLHGVNVNNNRLKYWVDGIVLKDTNNCICNQDNQIINMNNGKSRIWPNLLIDNYDVEANHSAYIGKFSEDKLFYLMSRGISRLDAYKLLLRGFLLNTDSIDKEEIASFEKEIEKLG